MHRAVRISKIGATRYQILRLKCTKFDLSGGSEASICQARERTALPRPLAVFGCLLLTGRTVRGGEGRGGLPLQLGSLDPAVKEGNTGEWQVGELGLRRQGTFFPL